MPLVVFGSNVSPFRRPVVTTPQCEGAVAIRARLDDAPITRLLGKRDTTTLDVLTSPIAFTRASSSGAHSSSANMPEPNSKPDLRLSPEHWTGLANKKILLIEDNVDFQDFMQHAFHRCGVPLFAVGSAEDGLAAIRHQRFDIIISDISLPGMDGYRFMQEVRAFAVEEGGQTPALAISAYKTLADSQHVFRSGFQGLLLKPFDPIDLLQQIASILRA